MGALFLVSRLIIPIPDLWAIAIAAAIGKMLDSRQYKWRWALSIAIGWGLVGLQLYISAAVLLPWLLPVVALWAYCLPLRRLRKGGN